MRQRPAAEGEAGYAMVAAVAGAAAFAYLAFALLAGDRGEIAGLQAAVTHARLAAAADAGIATGLHALGQDRTTRWSLDGRPHVVDFDGTKLTITVEDERGKAPLDQLSDEQARALFAAAGATGERLDALTAGYRDWVSADQTGLQGPGALADLAQGVRPRHGPPSTVDELIHLPGMDAALLARLRPAVTTFFGANGGFVPDHASPIAAAAMAGGGENSPEAIQRQREAEGERPDIDLAEEPSLAGRAVTVRVLAEDGQGGALRRSAVVELTGAAADPYWIRSGG